MKTLSDYTKQLRELADNLNLHGESVEMIVQMLANSLYISEVENISYTQEASLERATLVNSKIQHSINEMYSVFRGSNPRVILNIKSNNLSQYNLYDKIITSNNFSVYYIGYYDENSESFIKSGITILPESENTIILGLLSYESYEYEWTISDNIFYEDILGSNFSSDLYLYDVSNDIYAETTRIFSDHIKNNIFLDMTLPGYSARIYYPEEYQGLSRDSYVNQKFKITIFNYLSLSDISDSELKSISITGSDLISFDQDFLDTNKYEETYTGIIYISESERDGLETIHYKANKNRYTGSYLTTVSDLSYLLKEYFPSKIRDNGVTYTMSSSTEGLKTITSELDLTEIFNNHDNTIIDVSYLDLNRSDRVDSSEYLPQGTLSLSYQRIDYDYSDLNRFYDILTNYSVIPVTKNELGSYTSKIDSIEVSIYKNVQGEVSTILNLSELINDGYYLGYRDSSGVSEILSSMTIPITDLTSIDPILIFIIKSSGVEYRSGAYYFLEESFNPETSSYIEDKESIEFIFTPSTITKTLDDVIVDITDNSSYAYMNLLEDTLYISTDYEGNILNQNITDQAIIYNNGEVVEGTFSLIPQTGIDCEIDSSSGLITINSMTISSGIVPIKGIYNNNVLIKNLTIRKSIYNKEGSTIGFSISNDIGKKLFVGLAEFYTKYATITIEPETNKIISANWDVNSSNITFNSVIYKYNYQIIVDTTYDSSGESKLTLYYIPYSDSNILSDYEKNEFIENNTSYYITKNINITEGTEYQAKFYITLELYKNQTLDDTIITILQEYQYKFNQDLGNSDNKTDIYNEILSLITKISSVKFINSMEIEYYDMLDNSVEYLNIKESINTSYFKISSVINTIIK